MKQIRNGQRRRGKEVAERKKSSNQSAAPRKRRSTAKPNNGIAARVAGLGAAGTAYAKLLVDPCNAPLVRGVFDGSGSSSVQRFEVDFINDSTALATGMSIAFIPGMAATFSQTATITSDSTAFSYNFLSASAASNSPGYTFLSTNAASFRCLAACMQVSYPGSEQGRQGVVAAGLLNDTTLLPAIVAADGGGGGTTTTSQVRTSLQHVERTPAAMIEIGWQPGFGDQREATFIGGEITNSQVDYQGRNALVVSAAGLPAATGLRIRLVAVYEWQPRFNQGIVASVSAPPAGPSLNKVLHRITEVLGPDWYIHGSKALGSVMGNIALTKGGRNMLEF